MWRLLQQREDVLQQRRIDRPDESDGDDDTAGRRVRGRGQLSIAFDSERRQISDDQMSGSDRVVRGRMQGGVDRPVGDQCGNRLIGAELGSAELDLADLARRGSDWLENGGRLAENHMLHAEPAQQPESSGIGAGGDKPTAAFGAVDTEASDELVLSETQLVGERRLHPGCCRRRRIHRDGRLGE